MIIYRTKIMTITKPFLKYTLFLSIALTTHVNANNIVINDDSFFYPNFSVEKNNNEIKQTNSFDIEVSKGRYFFTWQSETLNKMLTEDYAQDFSYYNIEYINTRPAYKNDLQAGDVRYDITYAQRDSVGLNIIPVSYDMPMIFEYKDPFNDKTQRYQPKELGLNIQTSFSNGKISMTKKIPVFHLRKQEKQNLIEIINTESYFKQQYVDSLGAIAFAFQFIPEKQRAYENESQSSNEVNSEELFYSY